MYERILLATDGSRGAEQATEYGIALAERFDAAIEALYVVDAGIEGIAGSEAAETVLEGTEKAGRRALAAIAERASEHHVHREVRHGAPYEEIVAHADERDVDLVVIGTSGKAKSPFGSTAERVVTLASPPVLSVPDAEQAVDVPSLGTVNDVVVPLDGSDTAERAAEHALELSERFGSIVHAVYVVDTTIYDLEDAPRSIVGLLEEGGEETVKAFTQQAESVQVSSTWRVERGKPADEILARIDAVEADLVVMGTRGRGGLPERLLGSTTRRILLDSTCPVLSLG